MKRIQMLGKDRKDYSPENCQWVTKSENSRDTHVKAL